MQKKYIVRAFAGAGMALAAILSIVSLGAAHAATTTGAACPTFERSLSVGISGSDVASLQQYLHDGGYLTVSPTGYFGSLTQAAVASWQAQGNIVAKGGYGSGSFGPRSRAYFVQTCGVSGPITPTSTKDSSSFNANPLSGTSPLTVQFTNITKQGDTPGATINFGDGTSDALKQAPTFSAASSVGVATHTYSTPGTYTATLMNNPCANDGRIGGPCAKMPILIGSLTITVTAAPTIHSLNTPGSVGLQTGNIAEIRYASFYFTLASITSSTATINIVPVGCWNWFPSDPVPQMRCMIAVQLTPPQTLSVGQLYQFGAHTITLTSISGDTATFSTN